MGYGECCFPFSSHGGARLDSFQGYARSPAKPHKPRVHDGDGARGLPCARGPRVLCTRERIRGDLCSMLRARIHCTIAPVHPLIVASLRTIATQSDALRGRTNCDLHDFVRGLYWD
jgi:hypothetical protein